MAATALSWSLSLFIILLPLVTPQVSPEEKEKCQEELVTARRGHVHSISGPSLPAFPADEPHLKCFYNSKANVSCEWRPEEAVEATSCHIHSRSNWRPWNKTCKLLPVGHASWACSLILGSLDSQSLTSADFLNISVVCWEEERWRLVKTQGFQPFENLRLMAPHSLKVLPIETQRYNISWQVSQVSHYIIGNLEYGIRFKSQGHSWEDEPIRSFCQREQWTRLDKLDPDTSYELQIRVRAQRGDHRTWSPWSQSLFFKTGPADLTVGQVLRGETALWGAGRDDGLSAWMWWDCHASGDLRGPVPYYITHRVQAQETQGGALDPRKETLLLPWIRYLLLSLGCIFGFLVCVYVLTRCQYTGPWLKTVLKCHVPDPSEFFSQLSSQYGGDLQKWLSSPVPSSSFSPAGPMPEISPLEVLDQDTKTTQLLLSQQDKVPLPSPGGHSQASCFTNQGYFFFHLPDALEIEACQVYFTYDPCAEEEEEDGPGRPPGSPLLPLPPPAGEDDAYCTFPPGEDLLLFSPVLLGSQSTPSAALGGCAAPEERPALSLQEGPPVPAAPDPADLQHPLELAVERGWEGVPNQGTGDRASVPEASLCQQGRDRALTSGLALNTDAYLSLQELQAQDPACLV